MNELKKRFEEILNKYEMTGSYIEGAKRHDYKHYDKLAKLHIVEDLQTEMKEMLDRVRLEKKVSGVEITWRCPKCHEVGGEGEYCRYDRCKLVEDSFYYPTGDDDGYNQAVDDLDEKIGKEL